MSDKLQVAGVGTQEWCSHHCLLLLEFPWIYLDIKESEIDNYNPDDSSWPWQAWWWLCYVPVLNVTGSQIINFPWCAKYLLFLQKKLLQIYVEVLCAALCYKPVTSHQACTGYGNRCCVWAFWLSYLCYLYMYSWENKCCWISHRKIPEHG